MKALATRFSFVAGATAAKVAFGAVLTLVLIAQVPPQTTVDFLQLLLLQSVFIALISGAAFARGVAVGKDPSRSAALILGFLAMAALMAGGVGLVFLIPDLEPLWPGFIRRQPEALPFLVAGAAATGLHSILQGVLLSAAGAARCFLPTTVIQIGVAAALPALAVETAFELALIVSATQLAPLVAIAAVNWGRLAALPLASADRAAIGSYMREALSYGLLSAATLLVFVTLRETWQQSAPTVLAAYVFIAMRTSDLYLQVAFYMFAAAERTRDLRALLTPRVSIIALGGVALIAAGVATIIGSRTLVGDTIWLLGLVLIAQLLVDVARLPSAFVTARTISDGRTALFARLAAASIAGFLVGYGVGDMLQPEAALFYAQLGFSVMTVLIWRRAPRG